MKNFNFLLVSLIMFQSSKINIQKIHITCVLIFALCLAGTSTMLTFITLSSGQSKNLPKVSYIKASEIWFLGITVFIFASISEFAFVNIIWRRK